MQTLRSTSIRHLCLSFTASAARPSQNILFSSFFCRSRPFAAGAARWNSTVTQLSNQIGEEVEEEKPDEFEAVKKWTKTSGPTNTLFLGSLPYRIMEHDLKEAFSGYGEIKRVAIGRLDDGRSLGYGHVEFKTRRAAMKAREDHNESPVTIDNRKIKMDYAFPMVPRENGDSQRFGIGEYNPSPTIFIGNLHRETKEKDILEALKPLGSVVEVRISPKGFAHVDFEDAFQAENVLNHYKYHPIHVLDQDVRMDRTHPQSKTNPPSPKLYFTGWGGDATSLRSHFRALRSKIVDLFFIKGSDPKAVTKSGFIEFRDQETAEEALSRFNSPELTLAYSRPRSPPRQISTMRREREGFGSRRKEVHRQDERK